MVIINMVVLYQQPGVTGFQYEESIVTTKELSTPLAPLGGDQLLSVQELAKRFQVPLATIYGWRAAHTGPQGFRVGKFVRYRLSDVLAFEESQLALESRR